MTQPHIRTVNRWLTLEIGYVSDMGPASLYDAIAEALENQGVLDEANIIYMKGSSPELTNQAVDLWLPGVTEAEIVPPTPAPVEVVYEDSPANVG